MCVTFRYLELLALVPSMSAQQINTGVIERLRQALNLSPHIIQYRMARLISANRLFIRLLGSGVGSSDRSLAEAQSSNS